MISFTRGDLLPLWGSLVLGGFGLLSSGCRAKPPPEAAPQTPPIQTPEPIPERSPEETASDSSQPPAGESVPVDDVPDDLKPALPEPGSSSDSSSAQPSAGSQGPTAEQIRHAHRLLDSSRSKQQAGKYSQAFLDAQQAWSLVQNCRDADGRQLAQQVRSQLDALAGLLAPAGSDPPSNFKRLILK